MIFHPKYVFLSINYFQKHHVFIKYHFFLLFAILGIGRYGEKLTKVKKRFDLKGKI